MGVRWIGRAEMYTRLDLIARVSLRNSCKMCACTDRYASDWSHEDLVRTLKTSEAAALLNVSPNTLRAWERRFGYPRPQRSPAGTASTPTRRSPPCATRSRTGSRSPRRSASRVRALSADTHCAHRGARRLRGSTAPMPTMEAALALRSVERSVEEVLLPVARRGLASATARARPVGVRRPLGGRVAAARPALRAAADPPGRGPHRRRLAATSSTSTLAFSRALELLSARPAPACRPCRTRLDGRSRASASAARPTPSSSPGATPPTTRSPAGPTRSAPPPARCPLRCIRRGREQPRAAPPLNGALLRLAARPLPDPRQGSRRSRRPRPPSRSRRVRGATASGHRESRRRTVSS